MVTMSQKELQRVKVLENAVGGRLSVSEAARLLQLSERQVQRLKRRYRPDSVAWVQHGNRGRPMPWTLPAAQRRTILQLARGKYAGFHDSHLCQKLHSQEHLSVRRESVRRILRAAKLASPQKRRPRRYRARRLRRPRFGRLVLTDASRHDWREGGGPELTLIGFQDDATSQILSAHFQLEAENTLGYRRAADGMLLVSYRKLLRLSLRLPLPLLEHADRRPAARLSGQKIKKTMPRIYNLGGRPALAAVIYSIRGDRISLQLIRYFLVATTLGTSAALTNVVSADGLEPSTHALKGHCSAN
jgi:transposase